MTTEKEPRSLIKKLAKVMAQVERVEKRGENTFHHYKYATESDLVDAIRPLLAKENIMVLPSLIEAHRFEHTSAKQSGTLITDIKVKWTIEDGDSGEIRELIFPGCGIDQGDKGVYKALTGSEKYMLMKTFLIATGDDPEKDDATPPAPIAGAKVRDYKLKKPAVSPAAPNGKVPSAPLGNPGDEMKVLGGFGKTWVSGDFTNLVINGIRLWTKDPELSQLVTDLNRQIEESGMRRPLVEALGKVGRTPTALELKQLDIKEDVEEDVEEDEPQEIPF